MTPQEILGEIMAVVKLMPDSVVSYSRRASSGGDEEEEGEDDPGLPKQTKKQAKKRKRVYGLDLSDTLSRSEGFDTHISNKKRSTRNAAFGLNGNESLSEKKVGHTKKERSRSRKPTRHWKRITRRGRRHRPLSKNSIDSSTTTSRLQRHLETGT